MPQLDILEFPDPRLRTQARPVEAFDTNLERSIADMFETLYAAPGIGLAATQVNIHRQLIVIDLSEAQNEPLVVINPRYEVLDESPEVAQEGCLSVPGFYEEVTRPRHIRLQAQDAGGQVYDLEAEGLLAVCIQHEIDHLNGRLFVDYLSPLKRNRIRKKLEKQHRAATA